MSGRPHTIEIWFAVPGDGAELYLLAGGGERSDWVRNLRANAEVEVRIADRSWRAAARVVEDPNGSATAAASLFEKYQPRYRGDLTEWRDHSLPVAVVLTGSAIEVEASA